MHKLTLELEEVDYSLIAIHSTEEDYRLAYILNKSLNYRFNRFSQNLDFENSNAEFPVFEYKDENSFINFYLINNKHTAYIKNQENAGLFGGSYSSISYLIPEKKKIDFFLKIENCYQDLIIENLIDQLNSMNQIITSYIIDPTTLKSKENLIF